MGDDGRWAMGIRGSIGLIGGGVMAGDGHNRHKRPNRRVCDGG